MLISNNNGERDDQVYSHMLYVIYHKKTIQTPGDQTARGHYATRDLATYNWIWHTYRHGNLWNV